MYWRTNPIGERLYVKDRCDKEIDLKLIYVDQPPPKETNLPKWILPIAFVG